jgi:hypothetical protein
MEYMAWFTSTEKLLYKFDELQKAIGGSQRRNLPTFALNWLQECLFGHSELDFRWLGHPRAHKSVKEFSLLGRRK